jgi:hypothetical protein
MSWTLRTQDRARKALCRYEEHMPLAGHHEPMKYREGLPGSIERTCGACPEHHRRKEQKLTGGMVGVPPGSFLSGGGGAAQSDAQQAWQAPHTYLPGNGV